MSTSILHQETIDHQRFRIWGEVTVALPKILCASRELHCAFRARDSLFIATHSYARKEHAAGFLVPTEGIARVTAPRSGTITAVHFSEGQHVERHRYWP